MERAKTPFQDFIAAEISIESEDTVDCQARKKLLDRYIDVYISQDAVGIAIYRKAPHKQL